MGRMSTGTGMISMQLHIYAVVQQGLLYLDVLFMKTFLFRMLLQKLRYMKQDKKIVSSS